MGSTVPGSVSAPDSGDRVTQLVPHEDAPAYSDIATTATAAATSPLTFSPTTPRPHISVPQKKSSHNWTRREDKVSPTTDSLTTQVPLSGAGSARSRIPFPAKASSSVNPNAALTLREHGTTKASTASLTSTPDTAITGYKTGGRHVSLSLADTAEHQNVFVRIIDSPPSPATNPHKPPKLLPKGKSKLRLLKKSTSSSGRTGKLSALLNLHAVLNFSLQQG